MAKFIEKSVNLDVELYRNGDLFCGYISDNIGGSGIDVKGDTPQQLAEKLAPYIADYFYENEED